MQADSAKDAFTQEQMDWLEKRFRALGPTTEHGYDKGTLRTVAGGPLRVGACRDGLPLLGDRVRP